VGSDVALDGVAYRVVGVMPESFFFPDYGVSVWLPLQRTLSLADQVHGVARLRDGSSLAQAQAEVDALFRISRPDSSRSPDDNHADVTLFPLYDVVIGQYRLALWALLGAALAVALLAAANASHVLLADAVARRPTFAVRSALGATRASLLRLVAIETLLLGLLAVVVGLAVAELGLHAISWLNVVDITGIGTATLNGRVAVYAIVLSVGSSFIAAILPGAMLSQRHLQSSLAADGAVAQRSGGAPRLGDLLVSVETAMTVVLAVGALLLVASFVRLSRASWGFVPDNVLVVSCQTQRDLRRSSDPSSGGLPAPQADLIRDGVAALRTLPGNGEVSVARDAPLLRGEWAYRPIAQHDRLAEGSWPLIQVVDRRYFAVLGIPILEGRPFGSANDADNREIVVNESFARALWPRGDAVGQRLSIMQFDDRRADVQMRLRRRDFAVLGEIDAYRDVEGGPLRIAGVARDIRMIGIQHAAEPTVFVPMDQDRLSLGTAVVFLVRRSDEREDISRVAMNTLNSASIGLRCPRAAMMSDLTSASIGGRGTNRLMASVSLAFAGIALLLVATGVYGVVEHGLAQQRADLGVRMALGASGGDIVRMVIRRTARALGLGVALGLTLAWAGSRVLWSMLFGVHASDVVAVALVVGTVTAIGLCAAMIAAMLAVRRDPMEALKRGRT
jgi:predicted permease